MDKKNILSIFVFLFCDIKPMCVILR